MRVRVFRCTTDAEWSLVALTLLVGLGLAGLLVAGRADRADDDVLLVADEVVVDVCPDSLGADVPLAARVPVAGDEGEAAGRGVVEERVEPVPQVSFQLAERVGVGAGRRRPWAAHQPANGLPGWSSTCTSS